MDFERLTSLALKIAPELGMQPLYLLPKEWAPSLPEIGEAIAYAVPAYSPRLRQDLEQAGKWCGPGPAVIFNDTLPQTEATEILAHELAHLLPATPVLVPEQTAAEKENYLARLEEFVANPSGFAPDHPRWMNGHEKEFVRICLHLWWRLALVGEFVNFNNLCAGRRYDLSPAYLYWHDLASEPVQMQHATFTEILATPAPEAFNQRWYADLAYWMNTNQTSVEKVLAR